tara:strand:+ start:4688 stop:5734 length:1047 start_codon:yes stop_codon:yes gene_type:complete
MKNPILGIIGGGQLGSMLSSAAEKLNIKTVVYSDSKNAPAKHFCDEFIFGEYDNKGKIKEFEKKIDVVTYEFENIPFDTLKEIEISKKVYPKPEINKIIQNRFFEKNFLNNNKILTTKFKLIKSKEDLTKINNLIPGILKTCTLGYDGKGQFKIENKEQIEKLKVDFSKDYIFEKFIDLDKEISVILTRFGENKYEVYEPFENKHEDQILKVSKIPAEINNEIYNKSKEWCIKISETLNYIGTICVEFFIDKHNNLYVNEIAPRVHNSGHMTINTHNISQFENHVRAVCGLDNIKTEKLFNGQMINLIGNDIIEYRNKKIKSNEFFFDYLKNEIKPKRKMGHFTKIIK